MKIVFGAGGSGGHIIPAIAVAEELQAGGASICFIGNNNSMEQRLCVQAGYTFLSIRVQKLYRKLTLEHLKFPFLLFYSVHKSMLYLRQEKADVVFCTGGFVSGPVAIAAILCKKPLYIHESNSYPGLVTRLLAKYTACVFTAFADTKKHLRGAKVAQVGIPIKANTISEQKLDFAAYALTHDKPKLIVVGGSQGSLMINRVIAESLNEIINMGFELIWQTGQSSFAEYSKRFAGCKGVYIFDFSTDLPAFYRSAVLAITRAGAMTIAELEALKLPAILVPLASSAENHQYYNALEQQNKGLALLLEQKELSSKTLLTAIAVMQRDYEQYLNRLFALAPNQAVMNIVTHIKRDFAHSISLKEKSDPNAQHPKNAGTR